MIQNSPPSLEIPNTHIGKSLFSYFVEVPAALIDGFKLATYKNSLALDETGFRPTFLLIERRTPYIKPRFYIIS